MKLFVYYEGNYATDSVHVFAESLEVADEYMFGCRGFTSKEQLEDAYPHVSMSEIEHGEPELETVLDLRIFPEPNKPVIIERRGQKMILLHSLFGGPRPQRGDVFISNKPHEDDDFSYLCGQKWCKCCA